LSRFFGTSDRFWLNLQARYDLEVHGEAIEETLAEITPLAAE
jgi:plasmid maintenance system antidote protein VapI